MVFGNKKRNRYLYRCKPDVFKHGRPLDFEEEHLPFAYTTEYSQHLVSAFLIDCDGYVIWIEENMFYIKYDEAPFRNLLKVCDYSGYIETEKDLSTIKYRQIIDEQL
jgi:hypothetical protein